jgi:cell division protein FtsL
MPSFQPFIQRAGDKATTITTPDSLAGAASERTKEPVSRDVRMRRQQRWVFYAVFVLLFLAALIMILKVYADNTALVTNVENLNSQLTQKTSDLNQLRQQLANNNQQSEASAASLDQLKQSLATNINDLQAAVAKNKDYETQLAQAGDTAAQDQLTLERSKANTLNLILTLGVELSNKDISRIQVADIAVAGLDTDKDGLPDDMELALGTDPLKADTNGNGYNDREEIVNGFDPVGKGRLPIDFNFAAKYKGRIILNKRGSIFYGWYVAGDSKRYFLGSSANEFEALRLNDYWTKAPAGSTPPAPLATSTPAFSVPATSTPATK